MFARMIATIRQIAEGVGHPAYGCCSGDPIAWERDLLRQRAEAAKQAGRHGADAPACLHGPSPVPSSIAR